MTMDRTVRKYLAALALYIVYTELFFPILAFDELEIKNITKSGEVGETGYLHCIVVPVNASIEWHFDEEILNITDRINITNTNEELERSVGDSIMSKVSTVTIEKLTSDDSGNYTCVAHLGNHNRTSTTELNLYFAPSLVNTTCNTTCPYKIMVKSKATLMCNFNVYEPTSIKWWREGPENSTLVYEDPNPKQITAKMVSSSYIFYANSTEYSGVYYCEVKNFTANGTIDVQVLAPPTVIIDQVIPISSTELYLNWTVNTYFSPIAYYTLKLRKINDKEFTHHNKEIDKRNTSFVINGLQKSTVYTISLEVTTDILGNNTTSKEYKQNATTLDKDPIFVPNISINGFSATSVTIGWEKPPHDIAHLIHYYLLEARKKNENETRWAYHLRDGRNLPYMFDNLEPHSTYIFRVRACSDYTKTCGNWSQHMEAATLDGIPEKPTDVKAECGDSSMKLTWKQPLKKNAEIKGYAMEITGFASYKDRNGIYKNATWGPLSKFTTNDSYTAIVGDLQPNTRYTVRLSAVTRTRRRGQEVSAHCTTKPTAPDAPPRPKWRKIKGDDGRYMFKLYMPQMSERNGPICCYRVYVVRMPPYVGLQLLPLTSNIPVSEYKEVHSSDNAHFGAYITDVFSNWNFPQDSELVIGDGQSWFNETDHGLNKEGCTRCLQRPRKEHPEPPPSSTSTSAAPVTTEDSALITDDPLNLIENDDVEETRLKRSDSYSDYSKNLIMSDSPTDLKLYDGPLDSNSNYTLFVELITDGVTESIYSEYTSVLMPAPSPPVLVPSSVLEIALQVTCAVAALILLLMIIVCIRQTRRSRKMPPHAHLEMNSIPAIIRHMVGGFCGRQQLVTAVPPDKPPIAQEDLPQAYAERQADSDYLFQKEFELLQLLPDFFPDRTTHASEARENQHKNRYPDIKAYDQTRVKLCQIDSITGSDYINANYVRGYQDRKQFICAQGPTDTTVNDFWRMIWEHGLELIVMLTNLEEYSKIKCSKYWPEERGARAFGNITVHHVAEKRYSDYIVRELKITKQTTNSDGQPVVENNGIAKKNGDIKDAESSEPTSPREMKESGEFRLVRQYHFLMWKDFAAPEQPHSILKFIKRVNEAWSSMVGRPIVVHCSAGVGRTGTLVALDCLLEQLRATGQVAVFNTVAELRRQRNFLVQSLKQYVFVYRALVEYAHYGDTEISAGCLKPAVDRLRNMPEGTDKCLMEIEFEKILSHPLVEPLKSCAAGAGEELRSRNRSDEFLPYDRNRVILTPLPNREYSTYINASFIEAYDNTEGFIITQDPLPNTIMDFWRMVSEHNVTTIVMLSELGEGKCPRYWDDGTVQHEHISVQYEESESCPYYTRRQFGVTNDKSGEVSSVRHLQYQGWPTAPGHVPEVTRGLAELADAAAPNHDHHGTMLVHCQFGTERSPLFVALCTLIQQLRVERRVDVSGVARAVRHQRAHTIDTFLHYEFLYRAILNYAELHSLLEDS